MSGDRGSGRRHGSSPAISTAFSSSGKVSRLSRNNSVIAVEGDPFKRAVEEFRNNGHRLRVVSVSDATLISDEDFRVQILEPVRKIE